MRNACSLLSSKAKRLANVQLMNGIQKLGVQLKLMQMETISMESGENVIQTNVKRIQVN